MALCMCLNAAAQTPAETKLYTKTLAKPTVKAYDKFLTKYPESVYSLEIHTLRDSTLFAAIDKEDAAAVKTFAEAHPDSPLNEEIHKHIRRHNTSSLSRSEALDIVGPGYVEAAGWKMDNVDYVLGLSVALDGSIVLATCNLDGTKVFDDRTITRHQLGDPLRTWLAPGAYVTEFNSRSMLTFAYINELADGGQEHVTVLYDYHNDHAYNAMFYGTRLLPEDSEPDYGIEGQCLETLSGGIMTAEQMWLINNIADNPALKPLSKADLLTNESIKWWLSKNPKALTSTAAQRLNFGILDPESSLVHTYAKASKEKGDKYNAALFNLKGYAVIVSYSKASGEYLLVWCEPVCKNKRTDRLLNSIYFEGNGSSLAMFYYHGKRTYKYRVNLSDKSLRK